MKQRPILFSTPMVQSILAGRKTQTRRKADMLSRHLRKLEDGTFEGESGRIYKCPYGKVGDILWVRETFMNALNFPVLSDNFYYKASVSNQFLQEWKGCWKPSIFMPKDACRIWLEIVSVKVERLQDISEGNAIKEGSEYLLNVREWFADLWKSINGDESWRNNPWVWVIEFKQIENPNIK